MRKTIHWETPTYEVMRMDSEIGSYQEDDDPGREAPPFVREPEPAGEARSPPHTPRRPALRSLRASAAEAPRRPARVARAVPQWIS
jgi:hypothetical protein